MSARDTLPPRGEDALAPLPSGIADEPVLVAGSFDPVTNGHLALLREAAAHYRVVYATIFANEAKNALFSLEERLRLLTLACGEISSARVGSDGGMLADYARARGIRVSLRGYRDEEDLRYEREMALFNHARNPALRTVLLPAPPDLREVRSSAVRAALSRDDTAALRRMLPPPVYDEILSIK